MLETISYIEDLYRYNDWANGRLFRMCDDLSNAQLDEPRELGLGTLRNTLFHLLAAEQIWLERWQVAPWRPFPIDSMGLAPDDIHAQLRQVSQARLQMIKAEVDSGFKRVVNYKDAKGNEHSNPLDVLLLHVANHSVYHRAQALSYLKSFGRTVPIGLDFLVYKLARPTLDQPAESVEVCKQMGLQVAVSPGWISRWNGEAVTRQIEYGHWATTQILDLLSQATDEVLDRDFAMGPGSIRKTLMHLLNAELKWTATMQGQAASFQPESNKDIEELKRRFTDITQLRREQAAAITEKSAQEVLEATAGGMKLLARRIEAYAQLSLHGTHHRAQLVNMLRHSQITVPPSDLIAWWRMEC